MTGHQASDQAVSAAPTGPPTVPTGAPVPLVLRGVSRDASCLLLADEDGSPFRLEITPGLRAALRGDAARTRKVETPMDNTLRPRDIQARIRAGESAESVAEAAGSSLDKILVYAGPVLAEREHVAERAQRSSLRRSSTESAGAGSRALGDAIATHLRSCHVDPDVVTWDAWRREDGRWTLVGDYACELRTGSAHFTFDVPGNYVVLDDEDARWLVGEPSATPVLPRDDLHGARERRLAVASDEPALGVDTIEMVGQPSAPGEPAAPVEEQTLPLEAFFADAEEPVAEEPVVEEPVVEEPVVEEPEPPRRPVAKKKGRASVPSWDEIMFGGPND